MNFSTLKYFVTLAETLSFTKSARQHYIAQTTMSRQIAGLENELGVKLIERTTSNVDLTDAGRTFLKDVKIILADYEKALDNIKHNNLITSVLKIGYCTHFSSDKFLNMVGLFKESHPYIHFELIESSLSELTKNIILGKLDVILTFECEISECSKLDSINIIDDNVVIGVNKSHPLARFDEIDASKLAEYELLIINKAVSVNHRKYIIDCCINDGFVPRIKEIASYNEQLLLTRFNDAVSFFPETQELNVYEDIKFIKLNNTSHIYRINLAWQKENSNPALYDFLVFARKHYNKL